MDFNDLPTVVQFQMSLLSLCYATAAPLRHLAELKEFAATSPSPAVLPQTTR